MRIRVLFYRAKWDGHLLDNAISLWTKIFNWNTGPYSHAEIWIPDEHGNFTDDEFEVPKTQWILGTAFTSTMRGDVNGVVKRPAAEVLKHPGRWDYIEIEVSEHDYKMILRWMEVTVAKNPGYDIRCILSFFWYRREFKSDKFICSEFCERALWWSNEPEIFRKIRCPSPRRLSRWLVGKGYKIQSLGERHEA